MKKTKIAIDVDGVLLDFYKAFCNLCNRPVEQVNQWELQWMADNWFRIEDNDNFWRNLPILTHPDEIGFDFDCYLTAIPEKHKTNREYNLKSLGYPDKPVVCHYDKVKYCLDNGIQILIDDKPLTIAEARHTKIHAIHFKPYYFTDKPLDGVEYSSRDFEQVGVLVNSYKFFYGLL